MILTGAEIIIEILKENGVDTVFGYPGSSVLKIYDELYKNKDTIRHILTTHEQGAAHAADGYARASGKTGVCIATSGPGATNLVTGIATAYMDSVPLLALTCNVDRASLGKDSFQEVDINGITMPVTKHGYIIKDIEELAATMRRAFAITREGRPGPVIVDITKNVLDDSIEFERIDKNAKADENRAETAENSISKSDLKAAAKLIKAAKRPLVLVGGGVARAKAGKEALELAKRISAPVACSLMGKGATDEAKEEFAGMVGLEGNAAANTLIEEADLVIACGIRFSDRMMHGMAPYLPNAKKLQIDIDPAEINKNVQVDAYIRADAKAALKALLDMIPERERKTWKKRRAELTEKDRAEAAKDTGFSGKRVIQACLELTKGKAVITTEVGQHQLFAAAGYRTDKDGMFITSGGLGTMGYGLSAAIGAKLARPEKTVINFAGDGCFRMNMNELLTACRHNIPVIQIVFDNRKLGLVYNMQKKMCKGRYSATEFDDRLDFVKLAEALGVKAVRVDNNKELYAALEDAIASKEAVVVDCMLDM